MLGVHWKQKGTANLTPQPVQSTACIYWHIFDEGHLGSPMAGSTAKKQTSAAAEVAGALKQVQQAFTSFHIARNEFVNQLSVRVVWWPLSSRPCFSLGAACVYCPPWACLRELCVCILPPPPHTGVSKSRRPWQCDARGLS